MQNENRTKRNLLDFAFWGGIKEGGIESPSTRNPYEISTITKSTIDVAFWTPWK